MKKIYSLLLFIISFLLLSSFAEKKYFLQSKTYFQFEFRNYTDKQIENFVREVYGNHANDLVLNSNSRRLELYKNFLSRFDIEFHPEYNGKGFKKLSEIPLNNKYNPNLQRDIVLDIENFNPLKYDFELLSKKKQFIRFNNTDYIIIISPIQ